MTKFLPVVLFLTSTVVCAEEKLLKQGVSWLKGSLPEGTTINFSKSRVKFNGCNHREYELKVSHPLSDKLSLEAEITHAKGQLDWGIHKQSVSLEQYSIIPRYSVNERISLGAGVVYQSAPEFKTSQGFDTELPRSQVLLINSRFNGMTGNQHFELEISSTRFSATSSNGSWLERGQADNKISLNFEASF